MAKKQKRYERMEVEYRDLVFGTVYRCGMCKTFWMCLDDMTKEPCPKCKGGPIQYDGFRGRVDRAGWMTPEKV
jgi:rubrerythrin